MQEGLKVVVGADITGLQTGLAKAQQSISALSPTTKQFTANLTGLNATLRDAGNFAISTNLGFIAISNNLPILIDEFNRAKQATGSFGGALRAFGSSFISGGGLIALLGSVIGTLPLLIARFNQAGQAAKKSGDEILSAADTIRTAEGSILGASAEVNGLVQAFGSLNASTEERKRALESLRDINKSYFGDLKFEETTLGELKKRVDEYNEAILQQAIIQQAKSELGKLGLEYAKAAKAARDASRALFEATQGADFDENGVRILRLDQNTAQLAETNKKAQADFQAIGKQVSEYTSIIGDATDALGKFRNLKGGNGGVSKTIEQQVAEIARVLNIARTEINPDDVINNQFGPESRVEIPLTIGGVPAEVTESFRKFGEAKKFAFDLDNERKQITEFKQLLQFGLAQPLGDLIFNFLDKGKFSFKEFADVAIQSIKRIVAQIITSKIIQLLGNLIAPGAGSLLGGLFSAGGFGPSANIGGVGGGINVNVSGQFFARGTDLVGVISQSNQRIGRVG